MAEENGRNGRAMLPWIQFVWTVGIAIFGGAVSGVTAFYSLKETVRQETVAQIQQVRAQIAEERRAELNQYLPLTTYWSWREELKNNLFEVGRKLDRIEYRLK